ncbi:type II toxin-antitoxin system RelE family toxin [Escherichia coli]|uniref:type II toxin-antitoxin system RelE family toxin n=1 Tax=Escherichia coli TaxID=562 RepID=UPI000F428FA7|nr:type II toxin-antitoxin system RelE/ParE family toxin [Escherichia coli]RNJ10284.1 type II toxin-antitoxin system RelE/ParE family toxin [Escherichia coli]
MLPSETMIWQPEFTDKTLSRKPGAVQLGEFWRYRVGDYRILCEIRDDELIILVATIGHRREVYD